MNDKEKEYPSFGVYKGLQRPLEFLGLEGRYIIWGAIGGIGCFLLFVIVFALTGMGYALLSLVISLGGTIGLLSYKQRQGLHDKNKMKGVHIVHHIFKH